MVDSAIRYRDNWTQLETEWAVSDALTLRITAYHLTSHRHWKNVESYAWNAATRRVNRSSYIEIYHDQRQAGDRFDATWRSQLFGMRNELVGGFDVNRITSRTAGIRPIEEPAASIPSTPRPACSSTSPAPRRGSGRRPISTRCSWRIGCR
ncbi:Outer membrane vitamin B12 receptor BtuB [Azospirillum argentinense]|uniref:TonB-dependent receptor n=1 Tax=Azospirillum argentinense TaxID=2970906 RepID=A0A5B0KK76_9PROT|nr:Outer membrane vitamin B12 receptor BtuB [Azospirillum argentinense]